MNDNLTIYCCYHKDSQLMNDGNVWYDAKRGLLNPFINEMSMFYWIWKNDKTSKYIGTCHYRRRILKEDVNLDQVTSTSAVGFELKRVDERGEIGLKSFADAMQCEHMFADFIEYTKVKYGSENIFIDQERKMRMCGEWTILRNSFVLTRELFMGLCDFAFGYVDFYDKRHGLDYNEKRYYHDAEKWLHQIHGKILYNITINDHHRILGYFLEKLVDVYLQTYITEYHAI